MLVSTHCAVSEGRCNGRIGVLLSRGSRRCLLCGQRTGATVEWQRWAGHHADI